MNRRVGADELNLIAACRAYLAAQRQYASKIRDASGVRKFAQRLVSTAGKQDGLYWDPAVANGEESPFGPQIAEFLKSGRQARRAVPRLLLPRPDPPGQPCARRARTTT